MEARYSPNFFYYSTDIFNIIQATANHKSEKKTSQPEAEKNY